MKRRYYAPESLAVRSCPACARIILLPYMSMLSDQPCDGCALKARLDAPAMDADTWRDLTARLTSFMAGQAALHTLARAWGYRHPATYVGHVLYPKSTVARKD